MAYRQPAWEGLQDLFFEDLRDQSHVFVDDQAHTVGDGYPGRLLPTVLECKKREEGETRDVHLRSIDAENPALVVGRVILPPRVPVTARFPHHSPRARRSADS